MIVSYAWFCVASPGRLYAAPAAVAVPVEPRELLGAGRPTEVVLSLVVALDTM